MYCLFPDCAFPTDLVVLHSFLSLFLYKTNNNSHFCLLIWSFLVGFNSSRFPILYWHTSIHPFGLTTYFLQGLDGTQTGWSYWFYCLICFIVSPCSCSYLKKSVTSSSKYVYSWAMWSSTLSKFPGSFVLFPLIFYFFDVLPVCKNSSCFKVTNSTSPVFKGLHWTYTISSTFRYCMIQCLMLF